MVDLIGQFFEDTPRRLLRLRHAAARQDGATLRDLGHALRGAAGHFGACKVVELCERLEEMARAGALAGATARVQGPDVA